jgi:hypothetical protein
LRQVNRCGVGREEVECLGSGVVICDVGFVEDAIGGSYLMAEDSFQTSNRDVSTEVVEQGR